MRGGEGESLRWVEGAVWYTNDTRKFPGDVPIIDIVCGFAK